jgi:hypothetical protein
MKKSGRSYGMLSRDFAPDFDLSRAARTVVQRHPRNLKKKRRDATNSAGTLKGCNS